MARAELIGAEAIDKKGWWRAHQWLVLRRTSQLGVLGLFLLGPVADIWIIKGNLSSSLLLDTVPMTDPLLFVQVLASQQALPATEAIIGAVILLVFYLLVGGRAYCSWVCPVNMITDAAHWLRERLGIRATAHISRSMRYWVLGLTIVLPLVTGTLAFELVNPVSIIHRGIIFGLGFAWAIALAVFTFDLFVANRGWCGHICPMGAFYSLVGALSPIRVRADARARCDDCSECYMVCPEPQVIRPALKGAGQGSKPVIVSGNCTNCGRCIDVCAEEVFRFGTRFKVQTKPPHLENQMMFTV